MLPFTDTRPPTPNDAPVLVMSHSFGFSRREWTEVTDLLADEYRTVTIDMPGFGAADRIAGYSMEEMSRAFAEVITALGLTRYVLVGHSMSGKIAQILASRAGKDLGLDVPPEKVVLVTPTPLGQEVGDDEIRDLLLAARPTRADAEEFLTTHSALPLPPYVHERTVQDYLRASRAAWEAWLWHGVAEDWVERCAPVEQEVLLVAALQDPVWGPDMQRRLTMPHLASARMELVDCGHLVPAEAPQELAGMLRRFVGR